MIEGFHHVAVICGDYARSKAFYTEVLGLAILAETHRAERDSWKLDLALPGGGQIELFSFPAPPTVPTAPRPRGSATSPSPLPMSRPPATGSRRRASRSSPSAPTR